jgi:hypothetical protein
MQQTPPQLPKIEIIPERLLLAAGDALPVLRR